MSDEPRLIDHLIELRSRLLRATAGVLVCFAALMPFAARLYAALARPLLASIHDGGQLVAIDPAGGFFVPMKLAFMAALFAATPWVLYQLWRFVAPGLYRSEKRLAAPLLVAAVALFYTGCAFAYFVVLPSVFRALARFTPEVVAQTPDIGKYLDFVSVIFLAFGVSFELPIAVVVLVLTGVVTPQQLRDSRGYAVVGIFVVAAVITPPDVVSQLMLALPMCALYEAGIVAASFVKARSRTSVLGSTA